MTIPYPNAGTRQEARANAIHYAVEAADTSSNVIAQLNAERSKVWSAIAATFPEDSDVLVVDDLSGIQRKIMDDAADQAFDPREMAERNGFTDPETREISTGDTAVLHPVPADRPASAPPGTTVEVDSVAWDVLRVLALRYVLASMTRSATVLPDERQRMVGPWDLRMVVMPDSGAILVTAYEI